MTDGVLRSVFRGSFISHAVSPAPVEEVVTLLLDAYPGAEQAYSFRKLRDAYAGSAVRIRRSSDDAEADIGFSGNDFDTAAAAAHIGGGTGFITTFYDQSTVGSNNALQTTASKQPIYSASGLLSMPTIVFDGSDDSLTDVINWSGTITHVTAYCVMTQDGSQAQNTVFYYGNSWGCHATYVDNLYWDIANQTGGGRIGPVSQPTGWDDNPHLLQLYRDIGDTQGVVVDGVSLATGSRGDDFSGAQSFGLGCFGAGATESIFHKGNVSELVIWPTDFDSTDRAGIEANINDYYAVY